MFINPHLDKIARQLECQGIDFAEIYKYKYKKGLEQFYKLLELKQINCKMILTH